MIASKVILYIFMNDASNFGILSMDLRQVMLPH